MVAKSAAGIGASIPFAIRFFEKKHNDEYGDQYRKYSNSCDFDDTRVSNNLTRTSIAWFIFANFAATTKIKYKITKAH